jgi:hypothetical protein
MTKQGGLMNSLKTKRLAAVVTSLALVGSVPVTAAVADAGGVPNSHSKACPGKGKGKGPTKSAPNSKGKKCGFNR